MRPGVQLGYTSGLHRRILGAVAKGQPGGDAAFVYLHLCYTADVQGTNSVWAADKYIRNGTGLSEKRVKKAKALLRRMKLISYRLSRRDDGTVERVYIRVLRLTTAASESPESHTAGSIPAPAVDYSCGKAEQILSISNGTPFL